MKMFNFKLFMTFSDTDFVAESPIRSQTSSFTCSPSHNIKITSPRKYTPYELKDSTIPEEVRKLCSLRAGQNIKQK